jgi:hypothetical protein
LPDGDPPAAPLDPAAFGREWAARHLPAGPLGAAAREQIEGAIQRCYRLVRVGRLSPPTVLWCTSPEEYEALRSNPMQHAGRLAAARWRRGWLFTGRLLDAAFIALFMAWSGFLAWFFVTLMVAWVFSEISRWASVFWISVLLGVVLALGAVVGAVVAVRIVWRATASTWRNRKPSTGTLQRWLARCDRELAGPLQPPPWDLDGSLCGRAVADADPMAARMGRPISVHDLARHRLRQRKAQAEPLSDKTFGVLQAHEQAAAAYWTALRSVAIVLEPPIFVEREPTQRAGDLLTVTWLDGSVWYLLNDVRLPRRPSSTDWTVEEIHEVTNSEVRRVMIEAIGWGEYLRRAGLPLLADIEDPANPPYRLQLYEFVDPFWESMNLLVMTNASPDRGGGHRCYGEFVPSEFTDPVEAVAWQYGVPVETYRAIQRRT